MSSYFTWLLCPWNEKALKRIALGYRQGMQHNLIQLTGPDLPKKTEHKKQTKLSLIDDFKHAHIDSFPQQMFINCLWWATHCAGVQTHPVLVLLWLAGYRDLSQAQLKNTDWLLNHQPQKHKVNVRSVSGAHCNKNGLFTGRSYRTPAKQYHQLPLNSAPSP